MSMIVQADDLSSRIQAATSPHPRLLLKRGEEAGLKTKIKSDKTLTRAYATALAVADDALTRPVVQRRLTGRRLLGVSRDCLARVTHLAFAYRMTGDKKYLQKAEAEMLAAAKFKDWNPSHFLDVGEMTAALAIGYDWLYDDLDPKAREAIKNVIIEKGLKTSLKGGWWVTAENNWNQVCHGGLTLGALAVMEDEPKLAETVIARAIKNVPHSMAEYAPHGAYPEGGSYWNYGTTYNVLLIAGLESALGTDFGLSKAKGFMESSDYVLHVVGPTGLYFNYSDCGQRSGASPTVFWFAARRKDPSISWRQQAALKDLFAQKSPSVKSLDRLFPLMLVWAEPMSDVPPPKSLHFRADGKTPVGLHRTDWSENAAFLGVKGGSPSANHAHMDVGAFVMSADGVRWAEDLGGENYNALETKGVKIWNGKQDGQRWDVFRHSNLSHNVLVVDGKKQRVKGKAPIIDFSAKGPMPHTVVDLAEIYDGQLAAAKRGAGLRKDGSVLIQDDIQTLDKKSTSVRWGMVTRASVKIISPHEALLSRDGKTLTLRVLSPENAELKVIDISRPAHDYDTPNPKAKIITFTLNLPAAAAARLAVLLTPGSAKKAVAPKLQPLADWGKTK